MSAKGTSTGGINSLSKMKAYAPDAVSRGDAYSIDWREIQEEPGFNPRNYNAPDVKAHIRRMANDYKRGDVFPALIIVVRNGTPFVRDGHCRLKAIALAVSEGASIEKHAVTELKGDEEAQAKLVLKSNEGLKLKALERAAQYAKFSAWGWTDAEIGKEFGYSGEHVRQHKAMLELPMALKKLINEDVVGALFALELYNQYGTKAAEYVQEAADKQIEEQTAAVNKALGAGADQPTLALVPKADGAATDAGNPDAAGQQQEEQEEAPETPPAPKARVTGKHIKKVVGGGQAKLSKKTVDSMRQSFAVLSQRLDKVVIEDGRILLELNAEELDLLKQVRAQVAADTAGPEQEQEQEDGKEQQLDILQQEPGAAEQPA